MRVSHVQSISSKMASPARKRERPIQTDKNIDVSTLKASPAHAVQGVVLQVSPLKKSKTGHGFFDGKISDGVSTMRFVGYDPKVRLHIVDWQEKDTTVILSNCEVKQGRREEDGLEVHV